MTFRPPAPGRTNTRERTGERWRRACSRSARWLLPGLLFIGASTACEAPPPEPENRARREASTETKTSETPTPPSGPQAKQTGPTPVRVSPDDPLGGTFTLDDATEGLAKNGKLVAVMKTSLGTLDCELFDDKAPITVANFVGLARGLRPFKDAKGEWVKRPGYDGTTFHRVIRGFMIQGGDPKGTGAGEPGYVIPDEIWPGARHDERGLLCMANRGPNTNGMQFFILDGAAPHLDGGYTIFGKCTPPAVIEKIASVPTRGDRAIDPPRIEKVTIERRP